MTPLDRAIVLFAAAVLGLTGSLIAAASLGWDPALAVAGLVGFLTERRVEAALLGLILLLGGLHLLFMAAVPPREEGISRDTDLGQVRINLRAVETLVVRTAREVKGVRDVDATIRSHAEGVEIAVSLTVLPDLSIPGLSEEVQRRVDTYVRETAGVPVVGVTVEVRNVAGTSKARVE